jgi:hypothetical protein
MAEFGSRHQPMLILGGFLIAPQAYGPMAESLAELSGQPVRVVPVSRLDWLATLTAWGWLRLLDRVQLLAEKLAADSPSGRITLVGHSSGGVMLRLWLAELPLAGRAYGGARLADALITLGSPHTARRATALRLWVDRQLPGAFCGDRVRYLSVAGDLDLASPLASPLSRRMAARSYGAIGGPEALAGDPASLGDPATLGDPAKGGAARLAGDGLVPVGSALLAGSRQLVLPGVAHGGAFGSRWYGSPEVVAQWWQSAISS